MASCETHKNLLSPTLSEKHLEELQHSERTVRLTLTGINGDKLICFLISANTTLEFSFSLQEYSSNELVKNMVRISTVNPTFFLYSGSLPGQKYLNALIFSIPNSIKCVYFRIISTNSIRYILHLTLDSCSRQSYYPLYIFNSTTNFLDRNFSTCAYLVPFVTVHSHYYDGTHWFIVAHAAYFQTVN